MFKYMMALLLLLVCIGCGQTDEIETRVQRLSDDHPTLTPIEPVELCPFAYTPCTLHCDTNEVEPGTPGFCCNGSERTTCTEMGLFRAGDRDGDGVPNDIDNCVFTPNPNQANSDLNAAGLPQPDPLGDACDNCPNHYDPTYMDIDYDDVGDVCDTDKDNDGVDNSVDNCPTKANSAQTNSDHDALGDACDNCPNHTNPNQEDDDQDGMGNACDWNGDQSQLNCDSMKVGVPYCGHGFDTIDHCINERAPLPPMIKRGISTGSDDVILQTNGTYSTTNPVSNQPPVINSFDVSTLALPIDYLTQTEEEPAWGNPPMDGQTPGQTQIRPHHRTSNDGRIAIVGSLEHMSLMVYRPEVDGPQGQTLSTQSAWSSKTHMYVKDVMLDGQPDKLTYQHTLCDVSSSARVPGRALTMESNPRKCQPTKNEYGQLTTEQGDCYDLTWLAVIESNGKLELASVDFTAYVRDPKTPNARLVEHSPNPHHLNNKIYPHGHPIDLSQNAPGQFVRSRTNQTMRYTTNCACNTPECGRPLASNAQLFELTTTSDGRMLILNLNEGTSTIAYAVSEPTASACHAEGFQLFKPLSCLPVDSRPQAKVYGLGQGVMTPSGQKAFRDSKGNIIVPGTDMRGAYPWIDRAGKNIIYAQVNSYRDAWYAKQQAPLANPNPVNDSSRALLNGYPDQNASASGAGLVSLGMWTQGKIVVMDNLLNPTDWTGGFLQGSWTGLMSIRHNFLMALYRQNPSWIRPWIRSEINSSENQFNFINNQSPTLPFDVVWNVTTNANHNAQVIFDEYLNNNAFVVAHMNAPHTTFEGSGRIFPDDGFVPDDVNCNMRGAQCLPGFKFKRNPRLQNASTSIASMAAFANQPPADLRLRGGARVEPVALGGVLGKGVYLDGRNDYIDMGFQNPEHTDWFYSIWLDARTVSGEPRSVFFWPDGSWIGISPYNIASYSRAQGIKYRAVPKAYRYEPGQYFHFGVKRLRSPHGVELQFYLNGERVGGQFHSGGFSMESHGTHNWSWFVVGHPGPDHLSESHKTLRPWLGWIDEFRIYALDEHQNGYFEEYICNLALGSLINQAGQRRCEQLDLYNEGHPTELGPQPSKQCADKAHRSDGSAQCERTTVFNIQPIQPAVERPPEDSNQFCLTCHHSGAAMDELSIHALTRRPGVKREDDNRRQPMDWPARLGGQPYSNYVYPPANVSYNPSVAYPLDYWMYGGKL